MLVTLKVGNVEVDDSMLVNREDWIPAGEYNPHNKRPWIIGHEHGAFAIVFADSAQDAIDTAIDAGKLDGMRVSEEDLESATEEELEDFLCGGNASEYFHQEYLWLEDIKNPAFSFIALLEREELGGC